MEKPLKLTILSTKCYFEGSHNVMDLPLLTPIILLSDQSKSN